MQTVGLPTFQQTFAKCPFPEGVLAGFGSYPAEVRVVKADRRMEVRIHGSAIESVLLEQAQAVLVTTYRLSDALISVIEPQPAQSVESKPDEPHSEIVTEIPKADKPEDLFAQMDAMRRKVMREGVSGSKDGKKPRVKQIYGKINTKKKPVPIGELELDMGNVLVEGEVFNIEHRELPKRKAWVVCFDITDYTGSIRVN